MKFQCGTCKKFFAINDESTIENNIHFKCDQCANKIKIRPDLALNSSSRNSKIICSSCGTSRFETEPACATCTPEQMCTREELRIDNRDYDVLEVLQRGRVQSISTGKHLNKRKWHLPVAIASLIIVSVASAYLTQSENLPFGGHKKIETQIVIMKTGTTYYANKVEDRPNSLRITTRTGNTLEIPKEDVYQQTTATLE